MDCTAWWGSHSHWFWIMPALFMILMFVFAVRMIRRGGDWRWCSGDRAGWRPFGWWTPGRGPTARWGAETPCQILDRRYASGEITKEQYDQMKRDIESDPPHSGPVDEE